MKPMSLQRTGDFLQQTRCYLYASILPPCERADGGGSCGQHMLQPAITGVLPAPPPACAWRGLGGSLFLISPMFHITAFPNIALPQNYGNPHVLKSNFFFCHFFMKSKKWQGNGLGWWKTSGFAAWKHSSAMCCLYSWGKSVLLLPAFWQPPVLSTMWSTARLYAFIL